MAKGIKHVSGPTIREIRSINISMDLKTPERLIGYVPTQKSISLSREIFCSLQGMNATRAFCVAAPYGSGKSSAGLLWCILTEHGAKVPNEIKPITEALRRFETDEINPFVKFARQKRSGLAVALQGYEGGVAESIRNSLITSLDRNGLGGLAEKVRKVPKTLDGLFTALKLVADGAKASHGSVLIVWDEFGKVLEHCAAVGDS